MSIELKRSEVIKEHEHLCKLLNTTIKNLQKEYDKQFNELIEYKKSNKGGNIKKNKIEVTMHEFKLKKLKDPRGKQIKSPKQAIAIALAQQRKEDERISQGIKEI